MKEFLFLFSRKNASITLNLVRSKMYLLKWTETAPFRSWRLKMFNLFLWVFSSFRRLQDLVLKKAVANCQNLTNQIAATMASRCFPSVFFGGKWRLVTVRCGKCCFLFLIFTFCSFSLDALHVSCVQGFFPDRKQDGTCKNYKHLFLIEVQFFTQTWANWDVCSNVIPDCIREFVKSSLLL